MRLAIAAITAISALGAHAQYYKTLPKGVRAAVYRNIQTSEIDSQFNKGASLSPIAYNVELNAQTIDSIDNPKLASLFAYVKDIYPEGFDKLSAGAFRVSGSAHLNIDGYGLAYGISDKLTAYAALPMYEANVKMKYKKTKNNNFKEVSDLYSSETDNNMAQAFGNFLNLEKEYITGPTVQNMLTENYGYKEIGDWHGQGPGDLELGIMYNFLTRDTYGLKLTGGAVAPTGMEEDPDILQDIAFGDGQWDAFVEFGGGYRLSDSVILNSFARYTHQFASEKELRVPKSSDNSTSDIKGHFTEKRGNKLLLDLDADYILTDWVNFNAAYLFERMDKAQYQSDYGKANEWLAQDSETSSHSLRLKAEVTSVNAFMQQKFLLPAQIKVYYQTTLQGVNTPDVDRYEVEFSMFF